MPSAVPCNTNGEELMHYIRDQLAAFTLHMLNEQYNCLTLSPLIAERFTAFQKRNAVSEENV